MSQNQAQTVQIGDRITVSELAEKLDLPVTQLIQELVKNGVMATLNDTIDFDTAQIIVGELEIPVELQKVQEEVSLPKATSEREMQKPGPRPPVIAVMGHVDHGKTTLLDAIRHTQEVKSEAGGITQHISAYQIKRGDRTLTFLDTPGHEAFASLRQHGAHLTDLVILVVAADDGVKPQTVEAIKFANQAGVKIMVAINKIDVTGANPNRVMQELSDQGLNPEAWGGDTVMVEVSAKEQTGLDKLVEMAVLITDVEELTADTAGPAEGIVIESHMEKGRGSVVSLLVQQGELRAGDFVQAGKAHGKVRTLTDFADQPLKQAGPSTPATITGLKQMPDFGVPFSVFPSDKDARLAALQAEAHGKSAQVATSSSELLAQIHQDRVGVEFPVVIKADVRGSVTSVVEALDKIRNDKVSVRVISSGVGPISENDVMSAAAAGGMVYGFSVEASTAIKRLAAREGVTIRLFNVIYELLDDVTQELQQRMPPEIVETELGRLIIKGIFKTTRSDVICGGEVTKGKAVDGAVVKVYRDDELLGEAVVKHLQRGQTEASEVNEGEMCGLQLKTEQKLNLKEGDRLEFLSREEIQRKL